MLTWLSSGQEKRPGMPVLGTALVSALSVALKRSLVMSVFLGHKKRPVDSGLVCTHSGLILTAYPQAFALSQQSLNGYSYGSDSSVTPSHLGTKKGRTVSPSRAQFRTIRQKYREIVKSATSHNVLCSLLRSLFGPFLPSQQPKDLKVAFECLRVGVSGDAAHHYHSDAAQGPNQSR